MFRITRLPYIQVIVVMKQRCLAYLNPDLEYHRLIMECTRDFFTSSQQYVQGFDCYYSFPESFRISRSALQQAQNCPRTALFFVLFWISWCWILILSCDYKVGMLSPIIVPWFKFGFQFYLWWWWLLVYCVQLYNMEPIQSNELLDLSCLFLWSNNFLAPFDFHGLISDGVPFFCKYFEN